MLTKLQTADRVLNATGVNLFDDRPTPKFAEIRQGILDGTVTNKSQIYKWTGLEDGYGQPQESYLLRLLKGDESKGKALEDSAAGINLSALIGEFINEERFPGMSQYANEIGIGYLEDYIARNPDASDRDKKFEAIRISRNLKEGYKVIDGKATGPLAEAMEIAIDPDSDVSKKARADELVKAWNIQRRGGPMVGAKNKKTFTDKDYAALKSGDEFTDPETGKKYRKP